MRNVLDNRSADTTEVLGTPKSGTDSRARALKALKRLGGATAVITALAGAAGCADIERGTDAGLADGAAADTSGADATGGGDVSVNEDTQGEADAGVDTAAEVIEPADVPPMLEGDCSTDDCPWYVNVLHDGITRFERSYLGDVNQNGVVENVSDIIEGQDQPQYGKYKAPDDIAFFPPGKELSKEADGGVFITTISDEAGASTSFVVSQNGEAPDKNFQWPMHTYAAAMNGDQPINSLHATKEGRKQVRIELGKAIKAQVSGEEFAKLLQSLGLVARKPTTGNYNDNQEEFMERGEIIYRYIPVPTPAPVTEARKDMRDQLAAALEHIDVAPLPNENASKSRRAAKIVRRFSSGFSSRDSEKTA